ncbi:transporter [Herminiimonas fonticola]|uniref:Outer membrane putative beta-barrel porin/alpha-amylase n=1 Tax=Herminiimonas fonticola TaxID=303380 RepID=A0A4R6G4N4_9BURK|nr:transporter [Herminiimonas fonticola]RBA23097.1 putative MetA-pathway of phenol degradation [Herminiimonas fonticola]TDN89461.1 outer membrane putative beta-barrel porin/alpha-amylase [Herminiimonas fonticola]
MPLRKIIAILSIASCSLPAIADDGPPVTPYRPSVSSPAQLPAPGQLELELGGLSMKTNEERRDSVPYQFKLAFSENWGILLGGDAYVWQRDPDNRISGFGDTSITLKRAFLIDDSTAFGLEFTSRMPSSKDKLGSAKADYTLNGIFSKDIGDFHLDMNLNTTRIGAPDAETGRSLTGISSSLSTSLSEKWGVVGELSGTHQSGTPNNALFLTALTYSPSKRMTIDFGLAKGLNKDSPDWAVFTGIVVPIANFW